MHHTICKSLQQVLHICMGMGHKPHGIKTVKDHHNNSFRYLRLLRDSV